MTDATVLWAISHRNTSTTRCPWDRPLRLQPPLENAAQRDGNAAGQLDDGKLALLLTERIARIDPADSSQFWTHRISESLFRQAADEMLEDGYSEGSFSVAAIAALFVSWLEPSGSARERREAWNSWSKPAVGWDAWPH